MKRIISILMLCMCCYSYADQISITVDSEVDCSTAPCKIVYNTSKEVLEMIDDEDFSREYIAVQDTVAGQFDFDLMTRYVLGTNWSRASTQQKKQLTPLFKDLLIHTYSSAIAKFKDAKIIITNSSINNDKAVVSTKIFFNDSNNNQPIFVEYNLANLKNSGWKAYDVKIEGASLINTYRNQFNEVIGSSGVQGLIDQLKQKIKSFKRNVEPKSRHV